MAAILNIIDMWAMGDLQVSSATAASALLQQCSPPTMRFDAADLPSPPPLPLPIAHPRWPALWHGALVSRFRRSFIRVARFAGLSAV